MGIFREFIDHEAQKVVDGKYSETERVASFAGVVPASDPRIAIAVVVDGPQSRTRYGGTVAGPVFESIAAQAMRVLGVPEDLPQDRGAEVESFMVSNENAPMLPPELRWAEDSLVVPDVSGLAMRDVLALVDGSGLELSLQGAGQAVTQIPEAGSRLLPGERLEVRFQ